MHKQLVIPTERALVATTNALNKGESVEVALARATESMWSTVGTIMLIIALPLVAGIAIKTDRARSKPRGKRSRLNDGMLGN